MQISVLNVTISTQPTKTGKTYQMADVAYKNLTFGGKVEGKKLASFGAQADAFKVFAEASPGSVFDVEVVKNSAGYNDWIKATPAQAGQQGSISNQAAIAPRAGGGATTSPRTTYETPEERAQKQVYIIRQSSISSAIDLLGTNSKASLKVEDVLVVARKLEDFVFGRDANKVSKIGGASGFDDFEDVPFDTEVQVD